MCWSNELKVIDCCDGSLWTYRCFFFFFFFFKIQKVFISNQYNNIIVNTTAINDWLKQGTDRKKSVLSSQEWGWCWLNWRRPAVSTTHSSSTRPTTASRLRSDAPTCTSRASRSRCSCPGPTTRPAGARYVHDVVGWMGPTASFTGLTQGLSYSQPLGQDREIVPVIIFYFSYFWEYPVISKNVEMALSLSKIACLWYKYD